MESTVLIGCPTCGRRYRYDAGRFGYSGVRIRCRTCESVMRVDVPPALQHPQGQPLHSPPGDQARSQAPALGAADGSWEPPPVPPVEQGGAAGCTPPADALLPASSSPALPDADAPQGHGVPATAQDNAPGGAEVPGPPQALVADRDAVLRTLLAVTLREEGYQVTEVEDGPAVRPALAGRRPQVVVLNAFLPEILGVTLCSEIKRHPELNETTVILVGSLYRRDRFMRDPDDLYGADGFIDGSAPPAEVRKTLVGLCPARSGGASPLRTDAVSEHEELARLARIVVGDIILYNPDSAQKERAAGNFLQAFAAEMTEGQALVEERFGHLPGHVDLYFQIARDTIARHCEAAGMNTGMRA